MPDVAWRFLKTAGGVLLRRNVDLHVEGADLVPRKGPAIIAARHFHHLYDGCAILATIPRPVHILVGLDWVRNPAGRIVMERACKAAAWPMIYRQDGPSPRDDREATRALRHAMGDSLDLFRAGHILLVFPEGYPNIDPGYTPKADEDAFLPFQPGVVRLATLAAANGIHVPIVPAGFAYERSDRWRATLRFGEPLTIENRAQAPAALYDLERRVIALSHPASGSA